MNRFMGHLAPSGMANFILSETIDEAFSHDLGQEPKLAIRATCN